MGSEQEVVVVGAGVTGLTTAVVLAEAGLKVQVVADEIPGGTSLAAGAMWGPYLVEPKVWVGEWSQRSLEIFQELATDASAGVRIACGVEASRHDDESLDWARSLSGFEPVLAADLPDGYRSGYRFHVPLVDMPTYLYYLRDRLRATGTRIQNRRVATFADLPAGQTIVNCTGMGARDLVPDAALKPIRGEHVIVTNPGLTEFFSEDTGDSSDLLCIYPHGETVVLGGTAVDFGLDTRPDPDAAAGILQRCVAVEPRLINANVIEHRVGLRPTRPQVRVEVSHRDAGTVVHNYGHGGAGVTLSWGCAERVLGLL